MIFKLLNIAYLGETFSVQILLFRLLLKPCSIITDGQTLDVVTDYCQLLSYTQDTNSSILRSIIG